MKHNLILTKFVTCGVPLSSESYGFFPLVCTNNPLHIHVTIKQIHCSFMKVVDSKHILKNSVAILVYGCTISQIIMQHNIPHLFQINIPVIMKK